MPIIGCKDIRKDCPRCGCSRDKIEYWNCGPIVYICCPNCRYRLDESIDTPIGIDKLFSAWNLRSREIIPRSWYKLLAIIFANP